MTEEEKASRVEESLAHEGDWIYWGNTLMAHYDKCQQCQSGTCDRGRYLALQYLRGWRDSPVTG